MSRLVLVGAAHAHLLVVEALARVPLAGLDADWINASPLQAYSGRVTGWIAGRYDARDVALELAPLACAAGIRFHVGEVVQVDPTRGTVNLADGRRFDGDVISLGVGAVERGEDLPGVSAFAERLKPIDGMLRWRLEETHPTVVVGGGVAAVEVALCLRARTGASLQIVADASELPTGGSGQLRRIVQRILRAREVQVRRGRVIRVEPSAVVLEDGRRVPAARAVWATGPAPQPLLERSGCARGPTGGIAVDGTLRSVSHPRIFAAGDCADLPGAGKSGVYSVGEGPVLAHNLRAALAGRPLRTYRPQSSAGVILDCGDETAIAGWRGLAAHGRPWLALKRAVDARWMNRFRRLQRTSP